VRPPYFAHVKMRMSTAMKLKHRVILNESRDSQLEATSKIQRHEMISLQ
jgi:hypothetical protein